MKNEPKKEFDFVEFWAKRCKQDMEKCRAEVIPFVNAQLDIANEFYSWLAKTQGGMEKIRKLRGLR